MMILLNIFLKHQTPYLLFLLGLFVLPLGLFLQFSTYELPKVQYVFLILLFVSQYVFYNEKIFLKKIEGRVSVVLKKELKRVPSRKEIQFRSMLVVQGRGISIIVSALCILMIMIYFKEF